MITITHKRRIATFAFLPLLALGAASCSKDETTDSGVAETTVAAEETLETEATAETTAAAEATEAPATEAVADTTATASEGATSAVAAVGAECAPDKLALKNAGTLTIGTDSPAFPPWFDNDDPSNGKGFESAVAYAVAETLGFTKENVKWIKVPFNSSYAPGKKDFDFDINQISITDDRKNEVDFSDGYYDVNQAVVALKGSAAESAKTIEDLKSVKFGVQADTTSLGFVTDVVKPTSEPFVYSSNSDAKAALASKQIDAIVLDMPTAFFVTAVEIEGSSVIGQFASQGNGEQFGMLFEKGSALTPCVNQALAVLRSSGKLAEIQAANLPTSSAPVFQ